MTLVLLTAFAAPSGVWFAAAETDAADEGTITGQPGTADGYAAYLEAHGSAARPKADLVIQGGDFIDADGAEVEKVASYEGEENAALWTNQTGSVTWEVQVEQAGLYCLEMLYHPLEGKRGKIELSLAVNGVVPFSGAGKFTFHRRYTDALAADEDFETDNLGNQLTPSQEETLCWMRQSFSDVEGYFTEPYAFYFEAGTNTITLTCMREPFAVGAIRLYQPEKAPSYEDIRPTETGGAPEGYIQKIQAERPAGKSDSALRADYDKSSPLTEPSDPVLTKRNIIGGDKWTSQSQWIEWEYTVPETGYYKIALRYRQNAVRGFFTSRRVYLDGALTYAELDGVRFNYGANWQVQALGGDDPYLFYLEAGMTHVIRMEVTTGDMAPILRILDETQQELNALYRKIIMITSTSPDLYRDYELQKEIPGLLDIMLTSAETLQSQAEAIESMTGFSGSEAALLYRVAEQLQSFVKDPYTIPERLSNFRENISGLASWIMSVKEQPLELDYIAVMAPDTPLPKADAGFLKKLWYGVQSFMASFVLDYNSVGTDAPDEECLEVWVGTGTDQMYILRQLADKSFYQETGVPVRLKLVTSSLLVQAIMADIGPDVAINVARSEPVNLAMRGALEPLDTYLGFEETVDRFMPTAMDPYRFYGHTYAMPETQSFNMMFVRTDIFEELGLTPPETWDDLYEIAPILQRNNMEVGLPAGVFNMLLLQNGGQYYNDTLTAMDFDSDVANESFLEWVQFYTQYGYSLFKDDYNRFRTGEMPLTIMAYSFYCQLHVAAPEIMGRWEMLPIPGTRQEDGSILRADSTTASSTAVGSGTCGILLKSSDKKEEGWKFLEWWSRADTQTEFGLEVEETIGTAARYTTANREAFANLPWTTDELEMLEKQWANIQEIPEVPGGYYTSRNLDNAFRACVYRLENPREMLRYWTNETNKEIQRKLEEYHLGPQ